MHAKRCYKNVASVPVPTFPAGNRFCVGTLFPFKNNGLNVPKRSRSQNSVGNAKWLLFQGKNRVPNFPPISEIWVGLGTPTHYREIDVPGNGGVQ